MPEKCAPVREFSIRVCGYSPDTVRDAPGRHIPIQALTMEAASQHEPRVTIETGVRSW